MSTKIERNLPNNAYEAAVNAENASGSNPFATINDIPPPSGDTILVSGGASYSGTGLVYDVSVLVFKIAGIEYTTAETQVTLSTGDPTNSRFDAIVATLDANDSPIVEVIEGTPAATPITPAINAEQVLVQFVQILAGATSPNVTTEWVYRNDQTSDWLGSVAGNYANAANFTSSTPPPFAGTACCLSTFQRYGLLRGTRFEAPTPISREDYSMLSFRVQLLEDISSNVDIIYCSGWGDAADTDNTYLGVLPVQTYMDLSLVGQWQLVNIPTNTWQQNLGSVTEIGFISFTLHQTTGGLLNPIRQVAFDNIKFQTGTVSEPSGPEINILNAGTLEGATGRINFVPKKGHQHKITTDTVNEKIDVILNKNKSIILATTVFALGFNTNEYNSVLISSQNVDFSINNLMGSPDTGDKIFISIKDDGTSRNITWGSNWDSASGITLPTATVPNKYLYFEARYIGADWLVVYLTI